MSSTTSDGEASLVEDDGQLNLPTAHAETAKAPGQPVGVYGAAKYGECRFPTLQEQLADTDKAHSAGVEKTEA